MDPLPPSYAANARAYSRAFRDGAEGGEYADFFCATPLVHFRGAFDDARLLVYGRDPGYAEFASLTPFVGIGGRRLQGLLAHLGLWDGSTGRRSYLVTNLVRAHPPGNTFDLKRYRAALAACAAPVTDVARIATDAAHGRMPVVVVAGKANGALAQSLLPDALIIPHPSPLGDGNRFRRELNGGIGAELAKRLGVGWTPLPEAFATPIPEVDFFPGGSAFARTKRADPARPCARPAGAPADPYAEE